MKDRFIAWIKSLRFKTWLKAGGVLATEKLISRGIYYVLFPYLLFYLGSWSGVATFFFGHLCLVITLVVLYDYVAGRRSPSGEPAISDPFGIQIFKGMYTPTSFWRRMIAQIFVLDQLDPFFAFLIFRKEATGISTGGAVRLIWYTAITTAYWSLIHLGVLKVSGVICYRFFLSLYDRGILRV